MCCVQPQKAKDKDQKDHLQDARAFRAHLEHPPVNPVVHVPFEPPRLGVQDLMLRSVLQRLLLKSPGDTGAVVQAVQKLLEG